MSAVLRIDRLRLPLSIGVLPAERTAPQDVVISIEMQVSIPDRPSEVQQDYVSYAPVVEHLIALSESGRHIDLVEELADEIFSFIFRDNRIVDATVEVMKPEIFAQAESVGIRIHRTNANFPEN
jgi:dihydroneopterin aldolase